MVHWCVRLARPGRAHFQGLAVHPTGRFFTTVARDGVVRYWDVAVLKPICTLAWDVGGLRSIAFSPDGLLAAAGSDTGTVVVWDVDP